MHHLPPGQSETRQFPVVGECASNGPALDDWRLRVEGEVESPLDLTYREVLEMGSQDFVMDIHCVTGWSRFATVFNGVPLAHLLQRAKPTSQARFIQFLAYSPRHHDTSLPLDVAAEDCWLVHGVDGVPLSAEHGGPLRVVTRNRYFYKSLKWVHRIVLLRKDSLGYWERESAYHNNADPLREERYDERSVASREWTQQFRDLENFDEYRRGTGKILIKANLSNWSPKSKDLRGLQLKACTFDGADLRGVDFRGANLTLCNFFRADLSKADFTGADLDGADFSGAARLTDARFFDVSLVATRFFTVKHDGNLRGPKDLSGMIVRRATGLLEDQEKYLQQRGIVDED